MNIRLLVFALSLVVAGEATAGPIIVRHDRDAAAFLDLGRRHGAALCDVVGPQGGVKAAGTLIAPRWVLTAAHVAERVAPGDVLRVGGREVVAARSYVHPQWRGPEHDLGLVQLADPVDDVEPLPLYRGTDEQGREVVLVGRGMAGTGLTGPVRDDGQVRGATNLVDAASDAWIRFTFDAPGAATDLEGVSGPGDSGGPALLVVDGAVYVAGVSSGQDDAATGGKAGRYGVVEYYTRVSTHAGWIDQTLQAADAAVVQGDLGRKLDDYMTRLEGLGYSGGLLVAKDGEVVLSKGYGYADRAAGVPFTGETVFPVGSIAKQFTAAAVLKLEMMGHLRTTDLLTTYFDGVPEDKAGITLHHLLTHSSGLPGAIGQDFASIGREEYVRQALATPLQFVPGTGYEYSNVGFSLLAAIIEQVSGQSYDAFLRAHLYGPAEMEKTGYDLARYAPGELAHGYRGGEDWGTFADHAWGDDGPYWHLRGNGGILSTLSDMYRWHQALLGNAILSDEAKRAAYTPHVREGEGAPSFYGYGWVVMDTDRGLLITHNGGNPYFSNDFLRYLDAGVVIYISSNTGDFRAPRYSSTIADIVFGDPYEMPPERIETLSEADLEASPVGRRVRALLDVLAADEAALGPFIETHLDPRTLERNPRDELLADFKRDQQEIGAVEVASIKQDGPRRLELVVQSKATGAWWRLVVGVAEDPPHRIVGFGVMDTMPPPADAPAVAAPAPGDGGWGLPDSPTGRAVSAFLDAVSTTDAAVHRRFVEDRLAPEFRDAFSMNAHLEQFRRMHDDFGTFRVTGVQKTGPHAARVTLQPEGQDRRFVVELTLEPAPPHRIEGLGVEAERLDDAGADDLGDAAAPPPETDAERVEALTAYLQDLADRDVFSGAVLLARDGAVLFERAYGMADAEQGLPNRTDTKFNVGSMSKMFTALAIAQLAEQGALSFDDPIARHLPDYPNRAVAEAVTLHHLLTHTSGLGFYPFDHGARTPAGILPFFADEPPAFEPGSRMQYSNAGFVVLGLIVERVSGESYYDYVRRHIFEPAGMTDTGSFTADEDVPNRAVGYTQMGADHERLEGPRRPNTGRLEVRGSPAGGAYSTLRDMLRFGEALKNHTLLGAEMTEVLLAGKVEMGPGMRYAYGFGDHRVGGHRMVGHNGGAPGVGADFRVYLGPGYTAIVFTNYDPRVVMDVSSEIQRLVIG